MGGTSGARLHARPVAGACGFTLIEMIVTVAVLAILITVAGPSFLSLLQNNRLTAQANEIITGIHQARSEAIKRGARTAICSSADAADANATCSGSSQWESGWIVFVDTDRDGVRDAAEVVIAARTGLAPGSSLRDTGGGSTLGFHPWGQPNIAAPMVFRLCDSRGQRSAKQVVVDPNGYTSPRGTPGACP